ALAIATATDLKKRIVPDTLSYTLIAGGLSFQLIFALANNSLSGFFTALAITAATFAGAFILWKIGVWAGGDVKLFTGLAALNPVNYGAIRDFFGINMPIFGSINFPLFPLTLFIYSFLSMVPLAIFITIKAIAQNKELQKKLFTETKAKIFGIIISALLVSATVFFLQKYGANPIFSIPALLAIGFFGKKVSAIIGTLAFLASALIGGTGQIAATAGVAAAFFLLYLLVKLYLIAKSDILVEKIPINKLEEGMISAQTIVSENGVAKIVPNASMKMVINHFRNNNVGKVMELFNPKGKILASPANAGGLTIEQVKGLKEAAKRKEIPDFLLVKKSVPFVPAVLIGYVAAQATGDILWQMIF
ncbi:MAG: prepilin peptidase, partial [archaeon]